MKIAFIPVKSAGNAYVTHMQEAFEYLGDIHEVNYADLGIYKWNYYDIVVLNWRESYFVDSQTKSISYLGFSKELLRLLLFKCIARKSCLIVHNNYPHDLKPTHLNMVARLQHIYRFFMDRIICHSAEPEKKQYNYVPHPRYFEYLQTTRDQAQGYFLIFGRIERYKKIESIFPYLGNELKLKICGPCCDDAYLAQLKNLAPRSVEFQVGFLPEQEAQTLVAQSDGLILLGDGGSMIVSGSFHYGMSCNTKIFALQTPYLNWYKDFYKSNNLIVAGSISELTSQLKQANNKDYDQKEAQLYHQEHAVASVAQYVQQAVYTSNNQQTSKLGS